MRREELLTPCFVVSETALKQNLEILSGVQVHVALEGILDKGVEVARLTKELAEAEKFVKAIEGKLGNESFVSRAKPEVVEAEREKLATQQKRAEQIKETLADLG